jgi:hypothetical protein
MKAFKKINGNSVEVVYVQVCDLDFLTRNKLIEDCDLNAWAEAMVEGHADKKTYIRSTNPKVVKFIDDETSIPNLNHYQYWHVSELEKKINVLDKEMGDIEYNLSSYDNGTAEGRKELSLDFLRLEHKKEGLREICEAKRYGEFKKILPQGYYDKPAPAQEE